MILFQKLCCAILTLNLLLLTPTAFAVKAKPNIVLIVTDDQDLVLGGMQPMAFTQQLIGNRGATFTNAFTSSPICCPSRSSILSGQYAHNHKTYNNSVSGGCYGQHWINKVEPHTFPKLLQQNGYETFYTGKYLNEYKGHSVPTGWSSWFGLLGNSKYRDFSLNENGKIVHYDDGTYLTDLMNNLTCTFLDETKTPFFAMIAPPAPHAPFEPAKRHSQAFENVTAPRTDNFNMPSGPLDKHWLLTMLPATLPADVVDSLDLIHRKRWQTLLAVDEMVENIISHLGRKNMLANTYLIFTSDNGYHIGQFAQAYDKRQPYDTDIRIPLLVAGNDIQAKSLVHHPVALIDLAPTILEWAGIENETLPMDGKSFAGLLREKSGDQIEERQILIEYWGEGSAETYSPECPWHEQDKLNQCTLDAACHCQDAWNNTYTCIRHLSTDLNFIYCEFQDDVQFVESYNLAVDRWELKNIAFDMLPSVHAKYSLALGHLKNCTGDTCRQIY